MRLVGIPFSLIAEWMCFLASILLLKNKTVKFWKLFIPFLAITVGVETYCYYIKHTSAVLVNNQWLYNIYMPIDMIFHLFIYLKVIALKQTKKIIGLLLFILLGLYSYNCYSLDFSFFFFTTQTLFGGAVILLSILYYYSLFKQDEYHDLLKEPAFWFVSGCLLFYAATTGINGLYDEIEKLSEKNHFPIRYVIINSLNLILYGCWIKSFLCLQKTRT